MMELVRMARAASDDERLSDGMLYRKLADAIEQLEGEREQLEGERDAALIALSELCESCGGKEPHTLPACIAHITMTLRQRVERDAEHG